MTHLLIDTSVLIKWFHSDGEGEVGAARALQSAHVRGEVDAHILDLGAYEVGNVLTRALHWQPGDVADQLDDIDEILGPALSMTPTGRREAASLARIHGLTFYDASWAAAAKESGIALVSAHQQLLTTGLAESACQVAGRLRLRPE